MAVIIKNLIITGEVGKAEINKGSTNTPSRNTNGKQQRILKLEEFSDQMIQIFNDQKER
ncbi:MAG: hypothetical protein Mars2KO_05250 [Maribacter sp.]